MAVVEAIDLHRTYRTSTGTIRRKWKNVEAVRGVSFEIEKGELFGLLGPNGAGKTTTIKMLITLLIPTSGTARVLGHDVVKDAREVRKRIGYVFGGERGVYERLSGYDNLRYFAELYGVPPKEQKQRIAYLLDLVGLTGREQERTEGYSRGMKQRLHVARGLLHDPPVIFLDEPTIGLDPVGARELRATIASLVDAGKTVLLTTHYMFEADSLCDRIAVINKGEIVAHGTPLELKRGVVDGTVVEVEVFGIPEGTIERVRELEGVLAVSVEEREQAQMLIVQTAARGRAHQRHPRHARRRQHRTHLAPRADAGGRLRGARLRRKSEGATAASASAGSSSSSSSHARPSTVSWPFSGHCSSPPSPSSCSSQGGDPEALIYAGLGAAVMGIWTATSMAAGTALQRERWSGRSSSSSRRPRTSRS